MTVYKSLDLNLEENPWKNESDIDFRNRRKNLEQFLRGVSRN